MIDSHCHLTDERLGSRLEDVLSRARAARVFRFVTIGTSIDDDQSAIELCADRSDIRCAIGVHPNYTQDADLADLSRLRGLQTHPTVVALGEMGLDYHHRFASKERQMQFFEPQLQMAFECGKPVVIHSREAIDDTLAVMRAFPAVRAVFHCFTGSPDEARKILDQGYLIGFTGAVTFKKNDALREAAMLAPADRILIETDAPYLSPEPKRSQKVNEPALVVYVAETLARVRGTSVETIDVQTTKNAEEFYRWVGRAEGRRECC